MAKGTLLRIDLLLVIRSPDRRLRCMVDWKEERVQTSNEEEIVCVV